METGAPPGRASGSVQETDTRARNSNGGLPGTGLRQQSNSRPRTVHRRSVTADGAPAPLCTFRPARRRPSTIEDPGQLRSAHASGAGPGFSDPTAAPRQRRMVSNSIRQGLAEEGFSVRVIRGSSGEQCHGPSSLPGIEPGQARLGQFRRRVEVFGAAALGVQGIGRHDGILDGHAVQQRPEQRNLGCLGGHLHLAQHRALRMIERGEQVTAFPAHYEQSRARSCRPPRSGAAAQAQRWCAAGRFPARSSKASASSRCSIRPIVDCAGTRPVTPRLARVCSSASAAQHKPSARK